MASIQDLETGIGWFDTLARIVDRISAALSAIGTVMILGVMLLITADVIGRFFLGAPIPGVVEIVAMSILAIVFLQIANTTAQGKLTRSEALLGLIQRRNPRVADGFDALLHLAGAGLLYVMTSAFLPLFLRSYGRNQMVGTLGQFRAPIWPVHGIVLTGAALMGLILALRALALLIRAIKGQAEA